MKDVYIVDALRTPVGKAPRGVFKDTRPDDLLAHVLKGLTDKYPQVDMSECGDVIIGCAMPEAEQGMNVARIASLLAGLPDSVPGMTINRFCSSGLQSIALAAESIRNGEAKVMLAGGTESMSMVPMGGHKTGANPSIFDSNEHLGIAYGMGITAEIVAQKWQVSREQQEAFALESHKRASQAIDKGEFDEEIIPYQITQRKPNLTTGEVCIKQQVIRHDEGPRTDTSLDKMARLKTAFSVKGSVTAATSSQMSDGAGAVLLMDEESLNRYQLTPLAKFLSFAVAGVPPEIMGIGPIKAIPKALNLAKLSIEDLDWIELNEAFAAQSLAVIKDLQLDPQRVNPLGGAIALGHPLGATGAIRAATLLHGLKRHHKKYGMVTMCIGTGMGAAGIFESL